MCYSGKCMGFIKVETGSLIFGILSAIFTGISGLLVIGAFIYVNLMNTIDDSDLLRHIFASKYVANVVFLIFIGIMSSAFSFSVVLIKGVVKRNPAYVKAYYNYGVLLIWLTLVAISFGIPFPSSLTILIGAIYYLILRMVRMTYRKLLSNKVIQNDKDLEKKLPFIIPLKF